MEIKTLHIPAVNLLGGEAGTPSALMFKLAEKIKHQFKGISH